MNPPLPAIPPTPAPRAPDFVALWTWTLRLSWIGIAFLLWDELCVLLMDYWLLDAMGYGDVFATDFEMALVLFLVGLVTGLAVIVPAYALKVSRGMRRIVRHLGVMAGLAAGLALASEHVAFLLMGGRDFGSVDPVFGHDVGFYAFTLPALWILWQVLFLGALTALAAWLVCSWLASRDLAVPDGMSRLAAAVGRLSTGGARVGLALVGVLGAAGWWLARYDVLIADNAKSSVFSGATHVDVSGLFSTVNGFIVSALLTLAITGLVIVVMTHAHRAIHRGTRSWWDRGRAPVLAIVALLIADLLFKGSVAVRQEIAVKPDEPVIQMTYIARHIEATRDAFNLGAVETITFAPNGVGDPLPDPERLLTSTSLRNAPLWPGFASHLEELVDIHHADRILRTRGDSLVYGPLLDIFRQEQKLRAYYDFLDVDTTRYLVDGRPTMVVSAVREVPLLEPKPWLAWWGQQYLLYTHGYGLVVATSGDVTPQGGPSYLARGLPVSSALPQLQPKRQGIYYGEGSGSMAYTNVRDLEELDHPTDEGRATTVFPSDLPGGVKIDSLLKRLVFGYKSGQLSQILFSDLIHDETRVHYFRSPLERIARIAPHLFLDSDPYAVATGDGRVVWMINGMTWTDRYPYAEFQELGDASDRRSRRVEPMRRANYVRDAVKIAMDAFTGEVTLYLWDDEDPVAGTLADIYPGLFTARDAMPTDLRAQVKYPHQLLHVQFDDLYIVYQQADPATFFNMEDMWDDSDEVLGPYLAGGGTIRFSIEPFSVMVDADGDVFPEAAQREQFALATLFTPEGARNLRAIPLVYQDGDDYGRLISLQVAKGHYVMGPEQADSAIDQEPSIAQQLAWWSRTGLEVIRGHTTALVVENELIYIEPIFLRSQQNPLTQLKRVAVVFRGKARMAPTLREALTAAIDAHREPQTADAASPPEPPAAAAAPAAIDAPEPPAAIDPPEPPAAIDPPEPPAAIDAPEPPAAIDAPEPPPAPTP